MKQNRATKFQPSLANYLAGASFSTIFAAGLALLAHYQREWGLYIPAAGLGLVALLSILELLAWSLDGPMRWAADERGLWKGRGPELKMLFRWAEMTKWEVRYDSDGDPYGWVFHLKDREVSVLRCAVAKPSPDRFEAEVTAASGRRPRVNLLPKGKL